MLKKLNKLVFWNNILNQKGCDASNMFDEEVEDNSDEQFSDEEDQKNFKKIAHKVRKQRKRKNKEFKHQPNQKQFVDFKGQNPSNRKRDLKYADISYHNQTQR